MQAKHDLAGLQRQIEEANSREAASNARLERQVQRGRDGAVPHEAASSYPVRRLSPRRRRRCSRVTPCAPPSAGGRVARDGEQALAERDAQVAEIERSAPPRAARATRWRGRPRRCGRRRRASCGGARWRRAPSRTAPRLTDAEGELRASWRGTRALGAARSESAEVTRRGRMSGRRRRSARRGREVESGRGAAGGGGVESQGGAQGAESRAGGASRRRSGGGHERSRPSATRHGRRSRRRSRAPIVRAMERRAAPCRDRAHAARRAGAQPRGEKAAATEQLDARAAPRPNARPRC